MRYLTTLLIGLTGAGLAIQAATNARMSAVVEAPVLSALINFAVGGIMLLVIAASGILGRGHLSGAIDAPWWAWIGGIFGAIWVTATIVAVPRVGAAVAFGAVIFGQLVGAIVLDTYGLLGVPRIPLDPWRIAGAGLLFVGVFMMQHK